MNLRKLGKMSGMVAAVAMLAMVLQGCGGDDNGGVSESVHAQLQEDLAKAQADLTTARDAQEMAEAAAKEAMAAQAEAEEAKEAAEEAEEAAEKLRAEAIAAKGTADAAAAAANEAKMTAEAAAKEAMAAKEKAESDLVTANTDKAVAVQAAADAKAAQDKAEEAAKEAMAAQETAEDDRDAAIEAQEMAEAAQKTAVDAKMKADEAAAAAKEAQETAEAARDKAVEERDAALAAQMETKEDLEEALAALSKQTDAEAAQRARVDARAISRSAGYTTVLVPGIDLNNDGDFIDTGERVPVMGSTTKTVANYQGTDPRPYVDINGDGVDDGLDARTAAQRTATATDRGAVSDNNPTLLTGRQRPDPFNNEALMVTAKHTGSMVEFAATAGTGNDTVTYFDISTTAGSGDTTSIMDQMDVAGGRTKHIYLMTDIESPVTSVFGQNVPAGLSSTIANVGAGFDDDSQATRYALVQTNGTSALGAVSSIAIDADAEVTDANGINVDQSSAIDITLGSLAPTDAQPTRNAINGSKFAGSYAGVSGTYICNGICEFTRNDDDELLVGAVTALLFVPDGPTRSVADADYLVYGAWLKKPDSAVGTAIAAALGAGSNLFDADADAENAGNDAANGIRELTGKAKYKGSAAGYFAERHVDADAAVSGTFTATAELSADFDAGTPTDTANTEGGTISGMITGFQRSDGVDADWVVNLRVLDLGATADNNTNDTDDANGQIFQTIIPSALSHQQEVSSPAAGGFTAGGTSGSASGASWSGEWGVQFVGAGATDATSQQHPTGVVGTFGAQHGSPSLVATPTSPDEGFVGVIGGFGARKE